MASTFVDFVPSSSSAFQFQPFLNGSQYTAVITYSIFGQRYYLNLYDLSGNLILCRSVTSSGPSLQAYFAWAAGIATATTTTYHGVPVGSVVNMTVQETNSAFDGDWQGMATSPTTLTYSLPTNPNQSISLTGTVSFELNLVGGYNLGWLYYHFDTQQFEYQTPTT